MLDHLQRLSAALDVRPAELAGLLVLLSAGAVTTAALLAAPLVWSGDTAPPAPPPVTLVAGGDEERATGRIVVHVAGAVRRPGVVVLSRGARVVDAIDLAGGARPDARLDELNLAAVLEDGQRVLVPALGNGPSAAGPGRDATGPDGLVDLNRATAAELEALPGVGPVLASRIVAWREEHGPFRSPGDLRGVPGIGERTFQGLAELVRV